MNTISRYLTREKLEWMLEDKGIFFAPASDQSDKNEGEYDSDWLVRELINRKSTLDKKLTDNTSDLFKDLKSINKKNTCLSSWYTGKEESYDMWERYGKNGVLIVSDISLLNRFTPKPINQAIKYKNVKYCNIQKELSAFNPFSYKNEEFKFESEFRMILDMTKYSQLTGFEKNKYGEIFIGNEHTPSYESSEITNCMSEETLSKSHSVITPKENGYIINFNLNDIITEVRANPYSDKAEQEYFHKALCKAGIRAKFTSSKLLTAHKEKK